MSQMVQQGKKEYFKPCKNTGCTSLITFTKKPDGSGWLVLERDLARSELVEHKCKFYNKSQPRQQPQTQPQQQQQQQQKKPQLKEPIPNHDLVYHDEQPYPEATPPPTEQRREIPETSFVQRTIPQQPPPITAGSETQKEIRAIKAQLLVLIGRLERLERGF